MIWLPQTTDNSTYFVQSLEIRGIESRLYLRKLYLPQNQIINNVRIRKVLSKGVQQLNSDILLVNEGREDPNTTKSRPSSACQHVAGRLMMAQH